MKPSLPSRREFLASATGAAACLPSPSLFGQKTPANDRLQVACIGVRGRGGGLLRDFASQEDVDVTHVCDIDRGVLEERCAEIESTSGRRPSAVVDYRTLLDNPSIDAFVIGTPDHWHALPTVQGCTAGKDIYVEKPDGHNILEGKAMVAAARKHQRMVQLGTQLRSSPSLKSAANYVAGGAIGKVVFGRAWETDRKRVVPPVPDSDPPKGVDYDLWLGPAPQRPFNRNRFHGSWRWFFDYGEGDLGNDGVHRLDYCRMVMGVQRMPRRISCMGGKLVVPDDAQEWPDTQLANFDFGDKIITYEMRIGTQPPLFNETEGAAIYGEDGWVLVTNSGWRAFNAKNERVAENPDQPGVAGHLHIRNFIEATRSRRWKDLNQDIYQGHVSSVLCHAANIAWRTGKTLNFDSHTETFAEAEANQFLGRTYREGYELPTI